MRYLRFIVIGLWLLAMAEIPAAAAEQEIRFGSVAMDVPAVMHKRLTPLIQYLSQELNQPVSLKLAKDMPGAIQDIVKGEVELAYLTPVAYLKSRAQGNAKLVVKTVTEGQGSFKLMIVVRADSPIKSLDDLTGKSFAFGDKAALLQRAVVVGAGVKLETLGSYEYLGHYDNIVRAVMRGEYDAGILKDTMAYKWEDKGIRILYTSADLPPYNIAASGNMDTALFERIRHAFLKLDPGNPAHMEIIKALDKKYDGFAATSDQEYDIVRQLVAPFTQ